MKFKKSDQIKITAGKDKNKTGKIETVLPGVGVLISTLNQKTKHVKPRGEGKPGGRIQISHPIPFGNFVLVCPKCNKPTRVGFLTSAKDVKIRICRKCQNQI